MIMDTLNTHLVAVARSLILSDVEKAVLPRLSQLYRLGLIAGLTMKLLSIFVLVLV